MNQTPWFTNQGVWSQIGLNNQNFNQLNTAFGQASGQFMTPYFAAVDDSGNVYVADYTNDRIQKFANPATPAISATWGRVKATYRR